MSFEDLPDWWRRRFRRTPFFRDLFFSDIDEIMQEMEEMMGRELREFTTRLPKDLVRERKLPDGSTVKEWGPFVYGYSMTIGPDGKPQIREFGNVKPSLKPEPFGARRPSVEVKEEREPLVDVMSTNNEIKVVAELPGVEKENIKVHGTENSLTISVDTPQRKYYKEVDLPASVDPKTSKSMYKKWSPRNHLDEEERRKEAKRRTHKNLINNKV